MDTKLTQEQIRYAENMAIKRRVTCRLGGVLEIELNADQRQALDNYIDAYQDFYLARWGYVGPGGASLTQETESETRTRLIWEEAIKPLQNWPDDIPVPQAPLSDLDTDFDEDEGEGEYE